MGNGGGGRREGNVFGDVGGRPRESYEPQPEGVQFYLNGRGKLSNGFN